jgi:hypothetical protein
MEKLITRGPLGWFSMLMGVLLYNYEKMASARLLQRVIKYTYLEVFVDKNVFR